LRCCEFRKKATADLSTSLRFAQDDTINNFGKINLLASVIFRPRLAHRASKDAQDDTGGGGFVLSQVSNARPGAPELCATASRELGHRRRFRGLEDSGLGNGRDGDSQAGDSNGQLRTLPSRRVHRKPLQPLFIHSGEVAFLKKDHGGTHDSIKGSACGFENGRYILKALPGLFLDRIPNDFPGYGIVRPGSGDEDETRCAYRLAICWRRGRGVRSSNDLDCHKKNIVSQSGGERRILASQRCPDS
jgi:hypothetical protein